MTEDFSGELSSTKVKLIGYNTDAYAFQKSSALLKNHTKALVLGTSGASRAVTYVLNSLGIDYLLVSINLPESKSNTRISRLI